MLEWLKFFFVFVSYIACGCLTIFVVNKVVSEIFYDDEDDDRDML